MEGSIGWRRVALTATAVLIAAAPAAAAPPPTQFVEFREPFTVGPDTFEISCDDGLELTATTTFSGVSSLRVGKGVKASFFHYSERYTESSTITADSGEVFTVTGSGVFRELAVRPVEGSDRLFQFDVVDAGSRTLRDADGRVLLRDSGSTRESIIFDTLGDDEPGGEFVDFPDYRENGPHPILDGEAVCAAIAESLDGA